MDWTNFLLGLFSGFALAFLVFFVRDKLIAFRLFISSHVVAQIFALVYITCPFVCGLESTNPVMDNMFMFVAGYIISLPILFTSSSFLPLHKVFSKKEKGV